MHAIRNGERTNVATEKRLPLQLLPRQLLTLRMPCSSDAPVQLKAHQYLMLAQFSSP
jgi:hypothetical protein